MKKGFSLIEFLVVLGVIAIVFTISLIYLRSYQSESLLQNNARDIAVDLRFASEKASTAQITHEVRFDVINSSYTIVETGSETIIKQSSLDQKITIAETTLLNNTAVFNNLGGTSGPGTITLVNIEGNSIILDIRPSGYVKIR